jgi:4-hydroxy-3-methylbut-2-enyl diphosphate reductase
MGKTSIELASDTGFCFGVRRSVQRAEATAAKHTDKPIYTLGPIIHNPQVVEQLEAKGITPIADPRQVPPGVVIVRSHGAERGLVEQARSAGHQVVDATCPFVRRAQELVEHLTREGYQVVIVGESSHPETRGLLSYSDGTALVVGEPASAQELEGFPRIGVVAQTTVPSDRFRRIVCGLLQTSKELRVHNTICQAAEQRHRATLELAQRADGMIIVGGRNSANTSRLAELCRQQNKETHHIETASELSLDWVRNRSLVGLSAGTSTPEWIVKEVFARLSALAQSS